MSQAKLKTQKLRDTFKRNRLDIFLILGASICFLLSAYYAKLQQSLSEMSDPVASLQSGSLHRKLSGDQEFSIVKSVTPLFNMDTVWVEKGENPSIELAGTGNQVILPERSLVILKRSFKDGKIEFLTDKKELLSHKDQKTEEETKDFDNKSIEIPEPDEKNPEKSPLEIYPANNAIIYRRPDDQEPFAFTWIKSATGYFVIKKKSNGIVQYYPLKEESFIRVLIQKNEIYYWQVIDEKRRALAGPFFFHYRELNDESKKSLIRETASNTNVEIHW